MMPDARTVCSVAQDQVSSLPLLPALVTVHQPASATFAAPGVAPPVQVTSGFAINFSPGTPAAQVCTANRPMHVEYASYTGACSTAAVLCNSCCVEHAVSNCGDAVSEGPTCSRHTGNCCVLK